MLFIFPQKWFQKQSGINQHKFDFPLSYLVDSEQSLTLRSATNVRLYIQNLKVIDNQKKLTQLSRAIERWHTAKTAFLQPVLLHIGEQMTEGIHDHLMCG